MSSRIYAAEDDDNIREILRCTLESYGYEVEVFESAAPMLERMRQQLPDLVLMDIMMPEMDGLAAARAIRTGSHPQAQSIPIIAQTANAFAEDVKQAIDAGMNDHVAKPLDEARLRRVLAKYRK